MEHKTRKIGIFGGSFNPPHKMHTEIARYLENNKILDKIIFVPTGSKYIYKNNLEKDQDRYNMLKIITDKYENLEVSKYELKNKNVYTYETLKFFKDKYPKDEIYFICGLDNLSYIDTWKNSSYILNNFKILVIKRKGNNIKEVLNKLKKYQDNIIVVDMKEENISSTLIRSNLKDFESLIDKDVLKYIRENNLYIKK